MDLTLPNWLDIPKIIGLAVLVMAVVQYFKTYIPDKWVRLFAIGVGITLSFVCESYMAAKISVVKAAFNGFMAAIVADTIYGFFSGKGGGVFKLPSKSDEVPK